MQVYVHDTPTKLSLLILLQCRGNCSANAICAKERHVLVCLLAVMFGHKSPLW